VVVRRQGDATLVQALDPNVMVEVPVRPELAPIAEEATRRLDAAPGHTRRLEQVSPDETVVADSRRRLRRVQGQVAGILAMIEDGRFCREVIQQIAAAGRALDRAGVKLLVSQLQYCLEDEEAARRRRGPRAMTPPRWSDCSSCPHARVSARHLEPTNGVDVVVGGGHNGLVAACYLARAGREVIVLEALDRPGGGSRTEETVPGHRFDLHSAAHNIINMTNIPAELDLAGAGLVYQEMDPFSVAIHADGRRVRFHRSVEATVASLAEDSPADAAAYRAFIDQATPIVRTILPAISGEMRARDLPGRAANLLRVLRHQPMATFGEVLGPYESLLRRSLHSDLSRGPVAAFAAHAGVGPTAPGGSLYAFWQAAYHLFGQWHARGGAQGLVDALVRRLGALGGEVRCAAAVGRIETSAGRVRAVWTEAGERIPARTVITALDPKLALLELLDPPLVERHVA